MQISEQGLKALIKLEGGARLKAYKAHPNEKYFTIGVGHYGPDVLATMTITQEQAEKLLRKDLEEREIKLKLLVKVPLTQNQFDALLIFMFNVGEGAFERSTLLCYVNEQQYSYASNQFARWTKCGGVDVPGLVKRQRVTKEIFLNGKYEV